MGMVDGIVAHPTLAQLMAYADPCMEDEARQSVREHLGACPSCVERAISLNTLRHTVARLPEKLAPLEISDDCIPSECMGDFLGNRLPTQERLEYSRHLAHCDVCFERAAWFTNSSAKMAGGVLNTGETPPRFIEAVAPRPVEVARPTPKPGMSGALARWLASPVTAYAFAFTVLLFIFVWRPGGGDIMDLDSGKVFALYEKPSRSGPSFGFSDAGKKLGEKEAGLKVEKVSGGQLRFGWNSIKGAHEYHFSLQEIRPGAPMEIYETKTAAPFVHVDISRVHKGKAYKWSVSGESGADAIFVAVGQFALTR